MAARSLVDALVRSYIPLREVLRDLQQQENMSRAEVARALLAFGVQKMLVCLVDIEGQKLNVDVPEGRKQGMFQVLSEDGEECSYEVDLWGEDECIYDGGGKPCGTRVRYEIAHPALLPELKRSGHGEHFRGSVPFQEFLAPKDEIVSCIESKLGRYPRRWTHGDTPPVIVETCAEGERLVRDMAPDELTGRIWAVVEIDGQQVPIDLTEAEIRRCIRAMKRGESPVIQRDLLEDGGQWIACSLRDFEARLSEGEQMEPERCANVEIPFGACHLERKRPVKVRQGRRLDELGRVVVALVRERPSAPVDEIHKALRESAGLDIEGITIVKVTDDDTVILKIGMRTIEKPLSGLKDRVYRARQLTALT